MDGGKGREDGSDDEHPHRRPGGEYELSACPDCGRKIYLFGEGKTQEAADRYGLPLLAQMPIDPALAALVDAGRIEDFQGSWLSAAADRLEC